MLGAAFFAAFFFVLGETFQDAAVKLWCVSASWPLSSTCEPGNISGVPSCSGVSHLSAGTCPALPLLPWHPAGAATDGLCVITFIKPCLTGSSAAPNRAGGWEILTYGTDHGSCQRWIGCEKFILKNNTSNTWGFVKCSVFWKQKIQQSV